MSFIKKNFADRKRKRIDKELDKLSKDIEALSKAVSHADDSFETPRLKNPDLRDCMQVIESSAVDVKKEIHEEPSKSQDTFSSYFIGGGFKSVQPLRHERRAQRARAILLIVCILIVLAIAVKLFLA